MWSSAVFITLLTSAVVFGIAVTASAIVHPAMLRVSRATAIEIFNPFFNLSFKWQLPLSLVATVGALVAAYVSSNWFWVLGIALMQANGPYTAKAMMPTNRRLMDPALDVSSDQAGADLVSWGKLHLVRSILNGLAFVVFLVLAIWSKP